MVNFVAKHIFEISEDDCSIRAQWSRFYIEVLLSSLSKTMVVFIFSIILDTLQLTLITYLSFGFLRSVALGWHALSSLYCCVQSVFYFVIIPFFLQDFVMDTNLKLTIILIALLVIKIYAPQNTKRGGKLSYSERKQKRLSSIVRCIFLGVITIFFENRYTLGIVISLSIQTIMLLPVTKKVVQGKGKRNEENQRVPTASTGKEN